MRRANHQYDYQIGDDGTSRTSAQVRTSAGRWVGDARVDPVEVGEHDSSDDARAALVRVLRSLADAIEHDG